MNELANMPKRKPHRLREYDYSENGAYHITICTRDKKCIFGEVVLASNARPQSTMRLSTCGAVAERAILQIPVIYPCISVDKYIVMPNHVHMILAIEHDSGHAMHAPTASIVIQQMKGYVTKQSGFQVWQKSFHDHVIKNHEDYLQVWRYIDENALKWAEDEYFISRT